MFVRINDYSDHEDHVLDVTPSPLPKAPTGHRWVGPIPTVVVKGDHGTEWVEVVGGVFLPTTYPDRGESTVGGRPLHLAPKGLYILLPLRRSLLGDQIGERLGGIPGLLPQESQGAEWSPRELFEGGYLKVQNMRVVLNRTTMMGVADPQTWGRNPRGSLGTVDDVYELPPTLRGYIWTHWKELGLPPRSQKVLDDYARRA